MFYLLVFCSVIGLRQVFSTRMRSQQQLTSRRRNVKQGFGDAQTPTKGGKEGVTGCREQSWWVRQFLGIRQKLPVPRISRVEGTCFQTNKSGRRKLTSVFEKVSRCCSLAHNVVTHCTQTHWENKTRRRPNTVFHAQVQRKQYPLPIMEKDMFQLLLYNFSW